MQNPSSGLLEYFVVNKKNLRGCWVSAFDLDVSSLILHLSSLRLAQTKSRMERVAAKQKADRERAENEKAQRIAEAAKKAEELLKQKEEERKRKEEEIKRKEEERKEEKRKRKEEERKRKEEETREAKRKRKEEERRQRDEETKRKLAEVEAKNEAKRQKLEEEAKKIAYARNQAAQAQYRTAKFDFELALRHHKEAMIQLLRSCIASKMTFVPTDKVLEIRKQSLAQLRVSADRLHKFNQFNGSEKALIAMLFEEEKEAAAVVHSNKQKHTPSVGAASKSGQDASMSNTHRRNSNQIPRDIPKQIQINPIHPGVSMGNSNSFSPANNLQPNMYGYQTSASSNNQSPHPNVTQQSGYTSFGGQTANQMRNDFMMDLEPRPIQNYGSQNQPNQVPQQISRTVDMSSPPNTVAAHNFGPQRSMTDNLNHYLQQHTLTPRQPMQQKSAYQNKYTQGLPQEVKQPTGGVLEQQLMQQNPQHQFPQHYQQRLKTQGQPQLSTYHENPPRHEEKQQTSHHDPVQVQHQPPQQPLEDQSKQSNRPNPSHLTGQWPFSFPQQPLQMNQTLPGYQYQQQMNPQMSTPYQPQSFQQPTQDIRKLSPQEQFQQQMRILAQQNHGQQHQQARGHQIPPQQQFQQHTNWYALSQSQIHLQQQQQQQQQHGTTTKPEIHHEPLQQNQK
jgi:hypothetical protein